MFHHNCQQQTTRQPENENPTSQSKKPLINTNTNTNTNTRPDYGGTDNQIIRQTSTSTSNYIPKDLDDFERAKKLDNYNDHLHFEYEEVCTGKCGLCDDCNLKFDNEFQMWDEEIEKNIDDCYEMMRNKKKENFNYALLELAYTQQDIIEATVPPIEDDHDDVESDLELTELIEDIEEPTDDDSNSDEEKLEIEEITPCNNSNVREITDNELELKSKEVLDDNTNVNITTHQTVGRFDRNFCNELDCLRYYDPHCPTHYNEDEDTIYQNSRKGKPYCKELNGWFLGDYYAMIANGGDNTNDTSNDDMDDTDSTDDDNNTKDNSASPNGKKPKKFG